MRWGRQDQTQQQEQNPSHIRLLSGVYMYVYIDVRIGYSIAVSATRNVHSQLCSFTQNRLSDRHADASLCKPKRY